MDKKILFLGALIFGFLKSGIANAFCPVCIVAVGGGLGLSRWLGIDDLITSLWIGALLLALTAWTHDWVVKRGRGFRYSVFAIGLVYYALTIFPLYYYNIIGHPLNKIFGIDKIIFGIVFGTIVFLLGERLHIFLKVKNNGKQFFNYQKVVVPLLVLILTSLILWLII